MEIISVVDEVFDHKIARRKIEASNVLWDTNKFKWAWQLESGEVILSTTGPHNNCPGNCQVILGQYRIGPLGVDGSLYCTEKQ